MIKHIHAHALKMLLDAKDVLLIDVREPSEYETAHIEGALSVPLDRLCLEALPQTSQPIVMNCRSGKRSIEACVRLLSKNPHLDLYSLDGGILAWQQAGFLTKDGQ
jgi:rhodanese-related sulfurtransferase